MTQPAIAVTVEFSSVAANPDGTHVAGVVTGPNGSPTPFVGWIGLLEVLEAAATALQPQETGHR